MELRLLWTECLDIRKLCWKMVIMMSKRENRVYQLWGGHYFLERRIGLQRYILFVFRLDDFDFIVWHDWHNRKYFRLQIKIKLSKF